MKPRFEILEDRSVPATSIAYVSSDFDLPAGTQIADADVWTPGLQPATVGIDAFATVDAPQAHDLVILRGVQSISSAAQLGTVAAISVYSPASLNITGDITFHGTINLNNQAICKVQAGRTLTLDHAEVNGGALVGPGATIADATDFNGVKTSVSTVLTVNSGNLSGFSNGGKLTLNGIHWISQFSNASGGRMTINNFANATDFTSNGSLIINGTLANIGTSGLAFGGGSVTTVNRTGPVDGTGDGIIDLGIADATLNGGLMRNFGIVASLTAGVDLMVGFGGVASGSGLYGSVITQNGGILSPGGSPNTMATVTGDFGGLVTTTNPTATGNLFVSDPDANESNFHPASATTLYGSFSVNASGHWTYTLDPSRPELILALAHATQINDVFTILTADGTETVISVRITL